MAPTYSRKISLVGPRIFIFEIGRKMNSSEFPTTQICGDVGDDIGSWAGETLGSRIGMGSEGAALGGEIGKDVGTYIGNEIEEHA